MAVVEMLATWDVAGLSPAECLELVAEMEAVKGAAAALQARATVAFVESRDAEVAESRARGELDKRAAAEARSGARSEVALARRCSPAQADRHVGLARALVTEMPETMAALSQGEISEWRATIVARETATVSAAHRGEVDRRLAPDLRRLGDRAIGQAARRVVVELDQESVVERRRRAAASRRVSVRPAPDGMAYLTILGPMVDVIGAHVALTRAERARWVATGDPATDAERAADERGTGAWMTDTALRLLSGRAEGELQAVEVGLVMSPADLLPGARGFAGVQGSGVAEVPGHGSLPAAEVREHVADERADVWLRRLFTSPDGRDLVALDSRRRFFAGGLRRLVELRDPTCRVPWCDAPTRDIDHVTRHADGGATSAANALGLCARHNHVKDLPGWEVTVTSSGLDPGEVDEGRGPHVVDIVTPTGRRHRATAAPLRGHGSEREAPSVVERHLEQVLRAERIAA